MRFVILLLIILVALILAILNSCLIVASRQDKYEEEFFRNKNLEANDNEMDKEIIREETIHVNTTLQIMNLI